MPTRRRPRAGSLQFWPRKRAKRGYARIRNYTKSDKPGLLEFTGYKVGMTHVLAVDNYKFSPTMGEDIFVPATILECPPLKVAAIRFYKKATSLNVKMEIRARLDKEVGRKLLLSKKQKTEEEMLNKINLDEFKDIRLLVHTQPKLTSIGKKKPELFETKLSGSMEEKFNYAKEHFGKEILVQDIFEEGEQVDVHAITKGKGVQGPVKRFGITIRQHKSEKAIRNPGSLGPWCGYAHFMWRVSHAGKMGYHQRTEYNKTILKISNNPWEIEQKGGFLGYGNIKNTYLLLKGSIPGTRKRAIRFTKPMRPTKKVSKEVPSFVYISQTPKQGN
ncbi:50S ribosomal protein L3 [Candidatus Woesearchaeota archaeon]|nr:50S ribosomal protein L3 [Candidatus Woesearchaeota archaeon]